MKEWLEEWYDTIGIASYDSQQEIIVSIQGLYQ